MTSGIKAEIDALLTTNYPSDAPGAAVIVIKDGRALLRKGYGLANMELGVPIEPQTVFKVGSVTKQFTAVSILMLVEEGKLGLDEPIEKFFPDYPTHGHTITIEHLLTHTSGIKSYTSLPEWSPTFGKDYSVSEMIDFFKFKPMDFAPGTRWMYNNSAYFLLGAIIEKVTGHSYEEFLQQRIFDPLKMKQSYGNPGLRIIPHRASGYVKGPEGIQNCPYLSMTHPGGAGVIASTVDDLRRWDATLYTEKLVKSTSLRRAWTPYTLKDGSSTHYGYGWACEEYEGVNWIEHGGGIHGFVCDVLRIPQQKVFIALLSNYTGSEKMPEELVFRIAMHILGKAYREPPRLEVSPEVLEKFSGVYEIFDNQNHREEDEQIFAVKEGKLTLSIPRYNYQEEMVPTAEDETQTVSEFFPKGFCLNRLRFMRDENGAVTGFKMFNKFGRVDGTGKKTDKPIPA